MTTAQTVLFDLDGTLIDSVDLIVESYQYTCREHGLPIISREQVLARMGIPLRVILGEMVGDLAMMEACLASYREYNLAHHDEMVTAYPGVVDMVHALRDAGVRLGLVTSKLHAGARRGLRLIGLEDAMEVVIGADDVTNPKPDAEPVHKALEALGMPAIGCFFVGDSLHDMYCGKSAGVSTVGITWGPFDRAHLAVADPTHFCATPEELRSLVLGVV